MNARALSLARLASIVVAGAFAGFAARAAEAPAAAPAKVDPAHGEKVAAVCGACHTSDGSRGAPANPILQGQHPDYVVKQLEEFKAAKRVNAIMQGMAATLSPADMRDVAAFYASKSARPGFARNKEMASLGEKIWRGGIADRSIPACSGCHGPNGAGIPSQYPRLAGQHADYVEAQLLAFRSGQRHNNAAMNGVTAKMSDREIKAVSDYVTGLR